tara:strand:- start:342 stop:2576 length:2235 start_codon:yes stop_codon:yes gene_type:complete
MIANSVNAFAQEALLSQLSPEQIEAAKAQIQNNSGTVLTLPDIAPLNESLKKKDDGNNSSTTASEKKFGYDFISSTPKSISAVGDLPVPNDYRISLRDQLTVILSGSRDLVFDLDVKLDGTILFPEIGSVSVVGETIEDLRNKLENIVEQSFIGVKVDISVKNLSAKKIVIVGAVESPGTYLVNPFSTISSALAYSGGISEIGSLREIKLIRNNKEISSFDLYDLLIRGDRSSDLTIEAGDTILINAATQFVEINGGVKRPAIYEVLEGETVNDLVDFALGFNQTANKSNISISFLDLNKSEIVNKNISSLDQDLMNALYVNVYNYVSENTSNIQVLGAIEQPGFYDLSKNRNLKDLIDNLKFIDVYPWLAVLEQFDDEKLITSSILFSLNDPATYNSIELLPNSKIFFSNVREPLFDVGDMAADKIKDFSLTINHSGDISVLPVYGKYSVSSFVDYLGLDMSDVDEIATYVSPLENLVVNDNYKNMEFIASKYNTVSFRSAKNDLITVSISGSVEYPGTYTLNANSTLEELYQLIGSFKPQAYLDGITLTRELIRERQLKSIEKSKDDLNKAILSSKQDDSIGDIDIIMALSESIDPENLGRLAGDFSPKSNGSINTILFDGDTILVPKNPNSISVLGQVLNPVAFEYKRDLTVRSAINQAGGFQEYADRKRVYVIRANGIVERPKRNVFVGGNSGLLPGDTIIVPRKIITDNPAIQALAPITQILSDLAFSAAALDNLSNDN